MSALLQKLKDRHLEARYQRDTEVKSVLAVVLGEVANLQNPKAETVQPVTDDQVIRVLQKLVASNNETIKVASALRPELAEPLKEENAILEEFLPKLPKFWGEDEIYAFLGSSAVWWHEIIDALNDGKATGVAIKALKSEEAPVEGKTVAATVMKIRRGIEVS